MSALEACNLSEFKWEIGIILVWLALRWWYLPRSRFKPAGPFDLVLALLVISYFAVVIGITAIFRRKREYGSSENSTGGHQGNTGAS